MATRRLVTDIAVRQLRNHSSSTRLVFHSLPRLSFVNRMTPVASMASSMAPIAAPASFGRCSGFSSMSSDLKEGSHVVELPPNLKFHPRCRSSPFYGMKRVAVPEKSVDVNNDDNDENNVKDDENNVKDDVVGTLYDANTKPDIPLAIPLPQRLHVPILHLRTGETSGSIHLSEHTFGCDPIRVDILHRVVVYQRNKKRGKRNAGARTKTISEVSGSGRKVRPQKGSGRARAGHSRPPHWRGGAKAHGPKGNIQDYTTKLNKKVRKMGVRHALSQKLKEGNLLVVNDLNAPTHKTKVLQEMLYRFGISGRGGVTALLVDDATPEDAENDASVYGGLNINLKVASGNLPKVKVLNQLGCNVYDVLKFQKLVLSLAAVRSLEERLERDINK